ncbi:MAG: hypothetical protein Q8L14_08075 [Myxococcales bacterium]|nr:hypothetical protein [Myxococcales bacterium]
MPPTDLEKQLAELQTRLAVLEQERRRVRLRPALVALAVGLVGATAFSAAVWPANFLPDTPAHAADMNDYFNDLKARVDTAMPSGGIIFFGSAGAQCPPGWTAFQATDGRLIVGTTFGNVGRTVGNPALVDGENRQHAHQWASFTVDNDWFSYSDAGVAVRSVDWIGGMNEGTGAAYFPLTPTVGGVAQSYFTDRAGSNLPYIQLLACRKN